MPVLPIRFYPDPVLRKRCAEVEKIDDETRRLIDDMIETMHAAPGVGLAASQVGVELRIAVVDLTVGDEPDALVVLVNPRVLATDGRETEAEGCLSIPDFTEKVSRPESITVEFLDRDGERRLVEANGWLARAMQHEIDHLDGVLFVDHLRGLRRERARRALKRMAKELGEVAS